MNWKFDPALSSADYLALARKRARTKDLPTKLGWMLDWDGFDFGVHRKHVDQLLDRDNWSAAVIREGRKPRVFIDAYVNQSVNVEIRAVGGRYGIYFETDFARHFLREAKAGHYGPHRSAGEIMWIRGFGDVCFMALHRKSPAAKALLFGFKARLDELIREISARMDVVGAMPMQLQYGGKNVIDVDFELNIATDQVRALQEQMFGDEI